MALRIRYQYSSGASLSYSIERLSDGWNYDFSDGAFKNTTPTTLASTLPESTLRAGIYSVTLASTPTTQFSDGDYVAYVYDGMEQVYAGALSVVMRNGDDATVFSSGGGGGGSDPWATTLPGAYVDGTAGALLGAMVAAPDPWAVSLPGAYADGTAGALLGDMMTDVLAGVSSIVENDSASGGELSEAGIQTLIAAMRPELFKIDLTESVPVTGNSPNSIADCLNAARAQGFGKWIKIGRTLKLYGPDGATLVRSFVLNNETNPTSRS